MGFPSSEDPPEMAGFIGKNGKNPGVAEVDVL
jgi:hypothetical protein